jgi:hypothetical protein
MSVNFEIKGMLARLLATEDLIVEHKNVETACFNVHTRVLTLPMWEKASNTVYDMLVAHEVSHALYTPDEDWSEQTKVPQQFVNVVEDARVEKLIKRRYMGLAKTFYGAYRELNDEDFFMIQNEDISKLNLADRANLYFKIGNFLPISFTEREQEIIDMISEVETFADALLAAEILYKYCKETENMMEEIPQLNIHQITIQGGDNGEMAEEMPQQGFTDIQESEQTQGSSAQGDNSSGQESDQKDDQSAGSSQSNNSNQGSDGSESTEPEVKTMSSLEEAIKKLASNSGQDNVYLEIPKINLDTAIVSNKEIHNLCREYWSQHQELGSFEYVDRDYLDFKRSAQKEVNYLVKEFECRKSADSYARATTSRTGILDTARLHTYKYNEDLFKKITTLADGKNHGLVFVLDWSGSMSEVMKDTIKQLYNLIWFCRKVSIPFEVYAFTDSYEKYDKNGKVLPPPEHVIKKENEFAIDRSFHMMNLFTSKVRTSELEQHMKTIYRIVNYFGNSHCSYRIPHRLCLSGTPLNEAMISLYEILPKFQNENKLQKVHCVVLTDGEAGPLNYYRLYKRDHMENPYFGTAYVNENCYLRDRQTGHIYRMNSVVNSPYTAFTQIILNNLRDRYTSVSFVGIRILPSFNASFFIRQYFNGYDDEYYKIMERWKKERSFVLTSAGYHKYFGISSSALNKSSDFEVREDASKSQIKSAFVRSLSAKKMNKKILNEFIELIA